MYSSISVLIQPHRVKQATVSPGQDTALPWRDHSLHQIIHCKLYMVRHRPQTSRRGEQLGLGRKLGKASFKGDLEGKQKGTSGAGNLEIQRNKQGRREIVQQNTEKRTDV